MKCEAYFIKALALFLTIIAYLSCKGCVSSMVILWCYLLYCHVTLKS